MALITGVEDFNLFFIQNIGRFIGKDKLAPRHGNGDFERQNESKIDSTCRESFGKAFARDAKTATIKRREFPPEHQNTW